MMITASFPAGVTAPIQYGNQLKANVVHMSQFQLIPYLRFKEHFQDTFGIELSIHSLYTFNETAYKKRGSDAIDVLPHFRGVVCHDHRKPYFKYKYCEHALCNPHHVRELMHAHEQEKQE